MCTDLPGYEASCKYFSTLGYCSKNWFLGSYPFSKACRKTCNTCSSSGDFTFPSTTTTTTSACVDRETYCATNVFYCFLFASQNPHPCRKTCNACPGATTITTTTVTVKPNCIDSQASCVQWANFCNLLENLKPHPCAKTCKKC